MKSSLIKGFELYTIREDGKVFSTKTHKELSPFIRGGYKVVKLYENRNSRRHKSIHRLVAETFIPNPSNLPEVNHLDGNKENNIVGNLEWCTHQNNWDHAMRIGLNRVAKTSPIRSRFVGVSRDRSRNRWQAKIRVNNTIKKLGRFGREEDAAQMYNFSLYIYGIDRPYNKSNDF